MRNNCSTFTNNDFLPYLNDLLYYPSLSDCEKPCYTNCDVCVAETIRDKISCRKNISTMWFIEKASTIKTQIAEYK